MTTFEKLAIANNINNEIEVEKLKQELATYDYIGVKIATGVATREQYAVQIAYCETLRERIRELENLIENK